MRRTVFAFVFALFVSTAAQAVTLRDIVDLTKAGLGRRGAAGLDRGGRRRLRRGRRNPEEPESRWRQRAGDRGPRAERSRAPRGACRSRDARGRGVPADAARGCLRRSTVSHSGSRGGGSISRVRHAYLSPWHREDGTIASAALPFTSTRRSRLLQTIHGPQRYLTDLPAPKAKEPVYWGTSGKLRPDAWKPQ